MSNTETKHYDERLICFVDSLSYDFNSHTGKLYVANGGCCDMTGCIKLFKAIDPQVTTILPYSGGKEDVYYKKVDTKWKSYSPGTEIVRGEIDDSTFEK